MSKYHLLESSVTFLPSAERTQALQFDLWESLSLAEKSFYQWYDGMGRISDVLASLESKCRQIVDRYGFSVYAEALKKAKQEDKETFASCEPDAYKQQAAGALERITSMLQELVSLNEQMELTACPPSEIRRRLSVAAAATDISEGEIPGPEAGWGDSSLSAETPENLAEEVPEAASAAAGEHDQESETSETAAPKDPVLLGLKAASVRLKPGTLAEEAEEIDDTSASDVASTPYSRRKLLYRVARKPLGQAIQDCIQDCANSYIRFVNASVPEYFTGNFSPDNSAEFLRRARENRSQSADMALAAFESCPWNYEVYAFIFGHFPDERQGILQIARKFKIDLKDTIEEHLAADYAAQSRHSDAAARKARDRLIEAMQEFGVKDSPTLDKADEDYLDSIIKGYETADRLGCRRLIAIVKKLNVRDKSKVKAIRKLQERIKELTTAKDGVSFDTYLLECDVLDPIEVRKGLEYVRSSGRDTSRQTYLRAFETFSRQNIMGGREFQTISGDTVTGLLMRNMGYILIALGIFAALIIRNLYAVFAILPVVVGIIIQVHISHIRDLWQKMTAGGTVIHKVFTADDAAFEKMCVDSTKRRLLREQEARQDI